MKAFYFLENLNRELSYVIKDMTKYTNILIIDVHIEPGKTTLQYDVLSKEGFKKEEVFFLNDKK